MNSDYINSVLVALEKHYGKDVQLYPSTRKDKKFMVQSPDGKWIHFGQKGYQDWHEHKDPDRRRLFRQRNRKWADSPIWKASHLAYFVLW